jgi:hypothetical protein
MAPLFRTLANDLSFNPHSPDDFGTLTDKFGK